MLVRVYFGPEFGGPEFGVSLYIKFFWMVQMNDYANLIGPFVCVRHVSSDFWGYRSKIAASRFQKIYNPKLLN